MRKHIKVLMIALVAVIATAFAAGTAGANTITASPAGAITARSLGNLTFSGRGGIEISIECAVQLRGSLERTIANRAGGRVGSITEGTARPCNGSNTARPLAEARNAWALALQRETILFEANTGFATITARNVQFQVTVAGVTCLYGGSVETSLSIAGSPLVTRLLLILANAESLITGNFLCPSRGELEGDFEITRQTLRL